MELKDDPSPEQPNAESSFLAIGAFELSLILVALLIGWWFEFDPRHDMRFGAFSDGSSFPRKLLIGIVATVPLFVMLVAIEKLPGKLTQGIRRFMDKNVVPWISPLPVWQLVLLGLTAGICEELLFRGAVQTAALHWLSIPVAIGVTAAIFGLAHFATWWYAVLAAAAGLYLGWLFAATNSLVIPAATHALYDIVALIYLARSRTQSRFHPNEKTTA